MPKHLAMVKFYQKMATKSAKVLARLPLSTLLLSVFVVTTSLTVVPNANNDYLVVRFIIVGLEDQYHAAELDETLRAHPDILMSRSDWNTKNYLGFFNPATSLVETDLKAMLEDMGLQLRCYDAAPFDGTMIEKLDPKTCGAMDPQSLEK